MRTQLLVLAAALAFSACDEQPTAPVGTASRSADVQPNGQGLGIPQARPQLTITTVQSPSANFAGQGNITGFPSTGTLNATCPVGMSVVGGGYERAGNDPTSLEVIATKPNAANGWAVTVDEVGSLGSYATLRVTALCAQ